MHNRYGALVLVVVLTLPILLIGLCVGWVGTKLLKTNRRALAWDALAACIVFWVLFPTLSLPWWYSGRPVDHETQALLAAATAGSVAPLVFEAIRVWPAAQKSLVASERGRGATGSVAIGAVASRRGGAVWPLDVGRR